MINVLLVDDHTVVRQGLARIVCEEPDMDVVGEVHDGDAAVRAARRLRPDIVLMDLGMPGMSGFDATREISRTVPESRVLILTVYDQDEFLYKALKAGASGYLLKGADVNDLLQAIRVVDAGEVFIHPKMTTKLVRNFVHGLESGCGLEEYERLSPREQELLPLLADGCSNQELAEALHISPLTVQTHRQRIMQKLNLHSRNELLKYALRKGLIRLDE